MTPNGTEDPLTTRAKALKLHGLLAHWSDSRGIGPRERLGLLGIAVEPGELTSLPPPILG